MRLCRWSGQQVIAAWIPPPFLCPLVASTATAAACRVLPAGHSKSRRPAPSRTQRRDLHIESARAPANRNLTALPTQSGLPLTCPGCGAYSQTQNSEVAGFYDPRRKVVQGMMEKTENSQERPVEGASTEEEQEKEKKEKKASVPVCDRCHKLVYHSEGVPIYHPDVTSIQDMLDESPYRRNHIFHIVDAVDFPMSLVPRAHKLLDVIQRGRNRRAKTDRQLREGKPTMSFIITRSDLLAPKLAQTPNLLAEMRKILLQSLGRSFKDVRLQVRLVSSMRGWWTKEIKEEIRRMSGACWLLGKVNVGKSSLIETIFPKSSAERRELKTSPRKAALAPPSSSEPSPHVDQALDEHNSELPPPILSPNPDPPLEEVEPIPEEFTDSSEGLAGFSLPPAAPETPYPISPTVSHLPGTTAQPIRLRFGNGRGELIDLPGLDRKDMAPFVIPEKQSRLVMRERVKPDQVVIKPGQSLLVGDLVRITPKWGAWDAAVEKRQRLANDGDGASADPEMPVVLAAAFVPFRTHVTSTDKAVAHQAQTRDPHPQLEQLLAPGAGASVASAGTFRLRWNVTARRAGPLTRRDAVGLRADRLPFVVCSADIVLEGIGWVELTVQMRRRQVMEACAAPVDGGEDGRDAPLPDLAEIPDHIAPAVEVFSPEGGHVMARMPLNTFVLGGRRAKVATKRPLKSMRGAKKTFKREQRARVAASSGESS